MDDIEEDVNNLKNIESNRMAHKKKFVDIIKFHSMTKQLSGRAQYTYINTEMLRFFHRFVYDFSDIYEIHITGYYLWSLLTISSTLLVIHVEMVWIIICFSRLIYAYE